MTRARDSNGKAGPTCREFRSQRPHWLGTAVALTGRVRMGPKTSVGDTVPTMPLQEDTIMKRRNETQPAETGRRRNAVTAIRFTWRALVLGALLCSPGLPVLAQDKPKPKAPEPTVPEIFTLMGQFVRVAYNNEGYVTLGYRTANASVGQEWMLLDIGLTVRKGTDTFVLKRDALSLQTPDGKTLPLATQKEYRTADLRGMQTMANHSRDTISYFPGDVARRCAVSFFSDPDTRNLSYDQVELNSQTGCLGRIYFNVPGGIKTGQHWLKVKFAQSEVQVPFRILTKDEAKEFSKTWEDLKEEHDESMKQKEKK